MSYGGLGQRAPRTLTVTVSGGTGSTTLSDVGGNAIGYSIKDPPTGAYNIEFKDADGYGLGGQISLNGNTTIQQEFQLYGDVVCAITGPDGTYSVRIWFKAG